MSAMAAASSSFVPRQDVDGLLQRLKGDGRLPFRAFSASSASSGCTCCRSSTNLAAVGVNTFRWRWMMPSGRRNSGAIRRTIAKAPSCAGLADRRLGQDAHAGADLHRLLDRFDVVELHHHADVHAALPQVAVDLLADDQVAVEAHEILALEVLGGDGLLPGQACCGGHTSTIRSERSGITLQVGRGRRDRRPRPSPLRR